MVQANVGPVMFLAQLLFAPLNYLRLTIARLPLEQAHDKWKKLAVNCAERQLIAVCKSDRGDWWQCRLSRSPNF